nr:MAG: Protein of unknown function (DUF550) [Bacteriophage sp.]
MKTILEHARMLSRDRLSLGFNDTFSGMIEKLREELKELEEVPGSADPSYELADCLLVLARMFNFLNTDPEKAVEKKMRIIRRRYALARTLRDSFPEKTHEQLYQMAKRLLEAKGIDVRFGSCKECTYFCGDPYGGAHLCTCPNRKDLPLADDPCSEYTPK